MFWLNRMCRFKKFFTVVCGFVLLFSSACVSNGQAESGSSIEQEKIEWLSNDYRGFDYSRGQLNISGDGTAVTSPSAWEKTISCKVKVLFSEGSFDLLCGYTASPIYYEMTSLAAPTSLSGIIFRFTENEITLFLVNQYQPTKIKTVSFVFGENRELTFGKTADQVVLKIDGEVIFKETVGSDWGDYYGFGAHEGAILRVYEIMEVAE